MSNTLRSLSHPQPMVSNIEDLWARPQEPKRICINCPTKLSRYNPDKLCHACQRQYVMKETR